MQTEVLADKDSDCGSQGFITVTLTQKNARDYLYRYIIDGTKLVRLDNQNISKYFGKTVKLRTPMFCKGIGKERHLCNKCAGDFYYIVGKPNIGLACSRVAESTKQLNLQKFHDNTINVAQIDVDDMLL